MKYSQNLIWGTPGQIWVPCALLIVLLSFASPLEVGRDDSFPSNTDTNVNTQSRRIFGVEQQQQQVGINTFNSPIIESPNQRFLVIKSSNQEPVQIPNGFRRRNPMTPYINLQNARNNHIRSTWPSRIRTENNYQYQSKQNNTTGSGSGSGSGSDTSTWNGKWFPSVKRSDPVGQQMPGKDKYGRIQMGVSNELCDDGKTNLTIDWDFSPVNYTCFRPESPILPDQAVRPTMECVNLPKNYMPRHFCMNETIEYSTLIPSYGDHRPLWPKFGEYKFVPTQRWLHNIEHGAIVMLYHPCMHPYEVNKLKILIRSCVGKYIITPSNLVTTERPLVLVAWGCKLEMSWTDVKLALDFIRKRSLKGPEGLYTKEGMYDNLLIKHSNESGNAIYDRVTCHEQKPVSNFYF